jgi:hypothetical protein
MKRFIGSWICITGMIFSTDAQSTKSIETLNQAWFGYFNQVRFSDKWGLWADLHLRTYEAFVHDFSQSFIRFGITYYITDSIKVTGGYAFVSEYPADSHKKVTQPEHRPWQQIQWQAWHGKKLMVQRLRLEERYRAKFLNDSTIGIGYSFNFRFCYVIGYELPLNNKAVEPHGLSLIVSDEVKINFGKEIVYNYFDQNRFFVGVKYQLTKQNYLQVGYMNQFQQLSAGNKYRNLNIVRLNYFQSFDLRKKAVT